MRPNKVRSITGRANRPGELRLVGDDSPYLAHRRSRKLSLEIMKLILATPGAELLKSSFYL